MFMYMYIKIYKKTKPRYTFNLKSKNFMYVIMIPFQYNMINVIIWTKKLNKLFGTKITISYFGEIQILAIY